MDRFLKSALLLVLALGLCLPRASFGQVLAGNGVIAGNSVSAGNIGGTAGAFVPGLLTQDFLSGSTPSGWSTIAGSPNFGFTPALLGSFSLGCVSAASPDEAAATFTSSSEAYWFFEFKITALPSSLFEFAELGSSTSFSSYQVILAINSSGNVRAYDAGEVNFATASTSVTANTLTYVWVHYLKGSGSNAKIEVAVSTTLSRPAWATITNGASTANVAAVGCYGLATASSPPTLVYDHIGIDGSNSMDSGW